MAREIFRCQRFTKLDDTFLSVQAFASFERRNGSKLFRLETDHGFIIPKTVLAVIFWINGCRFVRKTDGFAAAVGMFPDAPDTNGFPKIQPRISPKIISFCFRKVLFRTGNCGRAIVPAELVARILPRIGQLRVRQNRFSGGYRYLAHYNRYLDATLQLTQYRFKNQTGETDYENRC
ncbi:MAG: hypothetical protein R3C26_23535 [Calditrichia bacterium]